MFASNLVQPHPFQLRPLQYLRPLPVVANGHGLCLVARLCVWNEPFVKKGCQCRHRPRLAPTVRPILSYRIRCNLEISASISAMMRFVSMSPPDCHHNSIRRWLLTRPNDFPHPSNSPTFCPLTPLPTALI